MIALPLQSFPLVYAGVFLAMVLLLWLRYDRRRERRRRRMRQGIGQCRLCAEWLRFGGKSELFRCPACGALNETNQSNDL